MKRIIAIALALLLLGCAALGEDAQPFALENGIAWGMSPSEVMAIEGDDIAGYQSIGKGMLLAVDDTAFRGREAGAGYVFVNDALAMALYALDAEDANPEALIAEMDAAYGEHRDDRGSAYFNATSHLTGILYTVMPEIKGVGALWVLPDGTEAMVLTDVGYGYEADDVLVAFIDHAGLYARTDASLGEPAPALEP